MLAFGFPLRGTGKSRDSPRIRNSRPHRCAPACGARKTLQAYADPRVFRPLREKRPAFICHRQRQAAFPQTMLRMVWSHEAANPHSATPTKRTGRHLAARPFWSEWREPWVCGLIISNHAQHGLGKSGLPLPVAEEGRLLFAQRSKNTRISVSLSVFRAPQAGAQR